MGPLKDMRGNHIEVGDTVAYPEREGLALWLNVASVVDVKPNGIVVRRLLPQPSKAVSNLGAREGSFPRLVVLGR